MLAMIVSGRRQVNNMDVYLQPLVYELKKLWEGIYVYDVSRPIDIEEFYVVWNMFLHHT
jgi:hypothetical protein